MNPSEFIQYFLELLRILVSWPVAIIVILLIFRRGLHRLFPKLLSLLSQRITRASIGSTSFEFGDVAAGALKDTITQGAEEHRDQPEKFAAFVNELLQKITVTQHSHAAGPLTGKRILWVDDHPENNFYESNLFGRLGARINFAKSTRDGIQQLDHGRYDLIITDVHRVENGEENPEAGYSLIAKTETHEPYVPSVIYTGNIQQLDPIKSAPASGVADDPSTLAGLVIGLIGSGA